MSTVQVPEVVRRYAITLLEAAAERAVTDAVSTDLEGLQSTLEGSVELRDFVGNRILPPETATKALDVLFEGKVDGLTLNFMRLLVQRRRIHLLLAIVDCALQLRESRHLYCPGPICSGVVRSASRATAAASVGTHGGECLRGRRGGRFIAWWIDRSNWRYRL